VVTIDSAWSGNDPTREDVETLVEVVVSGANATRQDASYALGDGLVMEVQQYLDKVSTEDDVELFFEVYGRPPQKDEEAWVLAILADLRRHGLDSGGAAPIVQRAIDRAIERLL
jgi:hypothetical protein